MDGMVEVAAALRRYVRAYPKACDTIDGIAAWWLLPQKVASPSEVIAAALAALVASGEMACDFGADGHAVYRAVLPAGRIGSQVGPQGS